MDRIMLNDILQFDDEQIETASKEIIRDTDPRGCLLLCGNPKSRITYRKPRRISEAKRQQARDAMKRIDLSANQSDGYWYSAVKRL